MQDNYNEKLLIAKVMDKLNISKTKNKVTNSEFLNEYEVNIVKNELNKNKLNNYILFGGYEDAKRQIVIAYPENTDDAIINGNIQNIIKVIKVELPSETYGSLQHKDYLGTIMSFGLARERVGDIIVYEDSAYIIVLKENAEYIKNSLELERRFKKAVITIIDIDEIKTKQAEFENITIVVSSIRLDNIISEVLNTSRKISQDLIDNEKVFVNYLVETKATKALKEGDTLTIRGKGKFIIEKFAGKNKKEKEIILVKKYK